MKYTLELGDDSRNELMQGRPIRIVSPRGKWIGTIYNNNKKLHVQIDVEIQQGMLLRHKDLLQVQMGIYYAITLAEGDRLRDILEKFSGKFMGRVKNLHDYVTSNIYMETDNSTDWEQSFEIAREVEVNITKYLQSGDKKALKDIKTALNPTSSNFASILNDISKVATRGRTVEDKTIWVGQTAKRIRDNYKKSNNNRDQQWLITCQKTLEELEDSSIQTDWRQREINTLRQIVESNDPKVARSYLRNKIETVTNM